LSAKRTKHKRVNQISLPESFLF